MTSPALSNAQRDRILRWTRDALATGEHYLSKGYQGQILFFSEGEHKLVVKVPPTWFPYNWLSVRMLRWEARVYREIQGIHGVPRCHGLLDDRYLVLEYIPGQCLRDANIQDPDSFFQQLLRIIRQIHAAGVGHADLKRKDNILVDEAGNPWIIDFGVATLRKRGFHPLNRFLFNTARRFDLNAWVKHKYRRKLDQVSDSDRRYLRRTWMERSGRRIKRAYRKLTGKKSRSKTLR